MTSSCLIKWVAGILLGYPHLAEWRSSSVSGSYPEGRGCNSYLRIHSNVESYVGQTCILISSRNALKQHFCTVGNHLLHQGEELEHSVKCSIIYERIYYGTRYIQSTMESYRNNYDLRCLAYMHNRRSCSYLYVCGSYMSSYKRMDRRIKVSLLWKTS